MAKGKEKGWGKCQEETGNERRDSGGWRGEIGYEEIGDGEQDNVVGISHVCCSWPLRWLTPPGKVQLRPLPILPSLAMSRRVDDNNQRKRTKAKPGKVCLLMAGKRETKGVNKSVRERDTSRDTEGPVRGATAVLKQLFKTYSCY